MRLLLALGLVFLSIGVTQADGGGAAADYHSWTAYPSSRYPLVVYSQEDKAIPQEVLFRAEAALAGFEKDYPGFHFHAAKPIEVPVAWDAPSRFAPKDENDLSVVPVPISGDSSKKADQSRMDEATSHILIAEFKKTMGAKLPDWFEVFILEGTEGTMLQTGSGPIRQINPANFTKMVQDGNFQPLDTMVKPAVAQPKLLFDNDPGYARWLSIAMYLMYAQDAPEGREFKTSLAHILVAAGKDDQGAEAKPLVEALLGQSPELTKAVKDYWAHLPAEDFVLAQNLEASVRLWASLATLADQAGKRYANFGDLAADVRNGTIPLPANIPRGLAMKANLFLDRDGFYELNWDGSTAVVREVAREGFGFEVRATSDREIVDQSVNRFTALAADLAKLPDPNTNPYHSDHYLIFTDSGPEAASDILLQADLYYQRVTAELPWAQPERHARLMMYYYRDAWVSGLFGVNYYQSEVGVTFVSPLGSDTMRHELTHQVVDFSTKGRFFWWFNEGIAEYYGHHIQYAGDSFVGPLREPYEVGGVQSYLAGRWQGKWAQLTIPRLVHLDPDAWSALKHGPYSLSWSLVYYMINADGGAHRALFDNYTKATAANTTDAAARDEAFNQQVIKLEPGWRNYWTAASKNADESRYTEARVRLTYLELQEAAKQGFTKEAKDAGLLNSLIADHQLKPDAFYHERVSQEGLNDITQHWSWQNKWTITGAGNDLRVACVFPNDTRIDVWHDAKRNETASQVTLSPATLAELSKSTMPPPPTDAEKLADANVNAAQPASPPRQAVGAGASFPPSAPRPAVAAGSFPPSAPRPAVGAGSFPPSAPRPAVAPGIFPPFGAKPAVDSGAVPPSGPPKPVVAPPPAPSGPTPNEGGSSDDSAFGTAKAPTPAKPPTGP